VRIRRRKPCFLFRFRLLGWNVLFTHGLLEHAPTVEMGPRKGPAGRYARPSKQVERARQRTEQCTARADSAAIQAPGRFQPWGYRLACPQRAANVPDSGVSDDSEPGNFPKTFHSGRIQTGARAGTVVSVVSRCPTLVGMWTCGKACGQTLGGVELGDSSGRRPVGKGRGSGAGPTV
jgi:hypothetical protein